MFELAAGQARSVSAVGYGDGVGPFDYDDALDQLTAIERWSEVHHVVGPCRFAESVVWESRASWRPGNWRATDVALLDTSLVSVIERDHVPRLRLSVVREAEMVHVRVVEGDRGGQLAHASFHRGRRVVVAVDNECTVFDAADGSSLHTFTLPVTPRLLAVHQPSHSLVVVRDDGVSTHDMVSGAVISTLDWA